MKLIPYICYEILHFTLFFSPHPHRKLFSLSHLVRVQCNPALPYIEKSKFNKNYYENKVNEIFIHEAILYRDLSKKINFSKITLRQWYSILHKNPKTVFLPLGGLLLRF